MEFEHVNVAIQAFGHAEEMFPCHCISAVPDRTLRVLQIPKFAALNHK